MSFEQGFMPNDPASGFNKANDALSLRGWVLRGAIREDDSPIMNVLANDDPVNDARPLNHFYDPVHDKPMTVGGLTNGATLGAKSPDWALGTWDVFANPAVPNESRKNHFSTLDAREAMWRALTLRDKQGNSVDSFDTMTTEQIRKAYWATTFRALGDVLHMIQDLAQPQHSRNEPHNGHGPAVVQQYIGYGSALELYTEARAVAASFFNINVGNGTQLVTIGNPPPLNLNGYPTIPAFSHFVDYFTSGPGPSQSTGYGMADYSNRGFFTQAKNLGRSDFTRPSNDPADYVLCAQPATMWDGNPLPGNVQVELYCGKSPVVDTLNPAANANGVPMTSKSIWDQFLTTPGTATYHLVREVYDAQLDLLLPRAVAYSAGLLDYFFRGRMEISLPGSGVYSVVDHALLAGDNAPPTAIYGFKGFKTIRLNLKNTTPSINSPMSADSVPQAMGIGTLVAVVKFHRNSCYNDALSGQPGLIGEAFAASCRTAGEEIVVSQPNPVDSVSSDANEVKFTFDNEIPINITDAYLQVVFRGVLGQEADAVVVATKDIAEPTYVSYFNATDYIRIGGAVFPRDLVASTPALLDQVLPRSCVDAENKLRDVCLQPLQEISLTMRIPTIAGPPGPGTTITASSLPLRRFIRFGYLTDAGTAYSINVTASCPFPSGPLNSEPFSHQLTVNADGSTTAQFRSFEQERGVFGWTQPSCVLSGDNTDPGNGAIAGMVSLTNLHPYAVSISPGPLD